MNRSHKRRGSRTYGMGRGKSHNCNAGNRGGRGRAGSGKKGDAKKPSFWKNPFKKKAFGMKSYTDLKSINISDVDENINKLIASGKIKKENISLNLEKLGYEKLLGTGDITHAVKVTIPKASAKAIEKIKSAGGEVVTSEEEVKTAS